MKTLTIVSILATVGFCVLIPDLVPHVVLGLIITVFLGAVGMGLDKLKEGRK